MYSTMREALERFKSEVRSCKEWKETLEGAVKRLRKGKKKVVAAEDFITYFGIHYLEDLVKWHVKLRAMSVVLGLNWDEADKICQDIGVKGII